MTENFESFCLKFFEFQHNHENLQQALKSEENKIISANIFLNEILNFDLIRVFCDLIEFNKKLWTKVLYGNFDKIEFESLNKFFTENFKRLNTNKINELKKQICNLENENKMLMRELEKVLFKQSGINEREKIRNILNAALVKNKDVVSSKSKNDCSANHEKSFNSNNSLKSSFRRKNHSKSFFIGNKAKHDKKSNDKNLKECSENNKSILNENMNKDLLDKNSFNKLIINPSTTDNQKYLSNQNANNSINNSYLVSNPNNNYILKNSDASAALNQPTNNLICYNSSYNQGNHNTDEEAKKMLNSILDKYKNENTYNASSYITGAASSINSYAPYARLQSRYINPYVPLNSESNKDAYEYFKNNISSNPDNNIYLANNPNKLNNKYYAGETFISNNNYNYNTISNIPNSIYNNKIEIGNNNNCQKVCLDPNKPTVYFTTSCYDKNSSQLNNQNLESKTNKNDNNRLKEPIPYYPNKINEGSANDETFGDDNKKMISEKDVTSNRSIKLDDNQNPSSNFIENNKDFSVLSSSIMIDNQDNKSMKNDKENKETGLKKTKSFSRLKNANKNPVSNNNKKHISNENINMSSYMDGKKITFNDIQNTEESDKNSKKSKINQRLNGILSPNANPLNLKQLNKELNRSVSPSNSISVANSITKNNKRNAKSIVKNEINRVSKVVEDFSSTKFLNEFINEKHSKDKNLNYVKKSAEKKKDFSNMNNNINNKFSMDQNLNLKSKQKIVNGRNIAMMRQKTSNNVVKVNQQINKSPNTNNNSNLKNLEFNSKAKNRSKSKTPKREKEIIFDNKSVSEKVNEYENYENKNIPRNNKLYSSENSNNNIFVYSNLNNKLVSNNSNSVGNLSNLNSSYDNQNVNKNFNPNCVNPNEYQGNQVHYNNYNPAFMNSNMSNIFSNNNSVNAANLDQNTFNYNQ